MLIQITQDEAIAIIYEYLTNKLKLKVSGRNVLTTTPDKDPDDPISVERVGGEVCFRAFLLEHPGGRRHDR